VPTQASARHNPAKSAQTATTINPPHQHKPPQNKSTTTKIIKYKQPHLVIES
jgi:hypothetical protein